MKRAFALLLILALLLCGCGQQVVKDPEITQPTVSQEDTLPDHHFSKMEYVRPDPQAVRTAQEACKTAAQSGDWEQLSAAVNQYLDCYDHFHTMYQLANIHYSADLSDSDWEAEHHYCAAQAASLTAAHRQLGFVLAATEFVDQLETDEYFGKNGLLRYRGKNCLTPEVEELLQQEASLQNQFYTLTEGVSGTTDPYEELGALLVQLVKLRHQIAAAAGFDSYAEFAYDYLHQRDYSPEQARAYLDQVRTQIAPILAGIGSRIPPKQSTASGSTFEYVKELAQNAGGSVAEAFELMETAELYDIARSNTKMNAGFTTYLNEYEVPFVFHNGGSVNVVVHEFGHFCEGYVSKGFRSNVDAAEVYSQGMEYMSMFCADGTQNDSTAYSLLLCYVSAAAKADFELRLYELPSEEVTADSIIKLYAQVGTDWKLSYVGGFNKEVLLTTLHYYLSPMYMLSYAISGDAALQLYELEVQESGAGLRCYEQLLASEQIQILSLLEEADLRSPFAPGAIEKSRDTFTQLLKK